MNSELFRNRLSELDNNYRERSFLLAVSGGIDSMVMLHLFQSLKLSFSVAHCNFRLRGEESNRDQQFVRKVVSEIDCNLYEKEFDTYIFAEKFKLNIQEAARKLRYDFFNDIAAENGFDYICTAHNQDDVVETLFMGLNRRGGLSVLAGIRESDRLLLRPMLGFSRREIEDYAAANMIAYVEDSSNQSDKYLRNKIRHHVLPLIEQWMPGFSERAASSVSFLQESFGFLEFAANEALLKMGNPAEEGVDLIKLQQHEMAKPILMSFLLKYGFHHNVARAILSVSNFSIPIRFLSPEFVLHVHRGLVVLRPREEDAELKFWYIESDLDTSDLPIMMTAEFATIENPADLKSDSKTAFLCADEIKFPLLVRKWEAGERFMPFGMNHSKKVGDFFTDIKITVAERQSAFVLCNETHIAWLIGYRIDQRFAVQSFPSKVLKLKLL